MKVQIIFAHGSGVDKPFGNKNSLPWRHNKEDLAHFKEKTINSVLVMGSNTFESLPGKLPDRPHVVISSRPLDEIKSKNGDTPDVVTTKLFPELIEYIDNVYGIEGYTTISVIGGPSIIESAYDVSEIVYKTVIFDTINEYDVCIDTTYLESKFSLIDVEHQRCSNGSEIAKQTYIKNSAMTRFIDKV